MARIRKSVPKYELGIESVEDKRRSDLYGDLSHAFITGTTALANVGTFKENEILQGIGQGSQLGGSIGSLAGPIGGLIGAGAGAIGGAMFGAAQKKKREAIEERQREMQRAAALDQFRNANTFGLDFGQSPITFDNGTTNPLTPHNPDFITVTETRPPPKETIAYYKSQIEHNDRVMEQFAQARQQYVIDQLNSLVKSMIEPADRKTKKDNVDKTETIQLSNRDVSRASGKAKKFFFEDGGTIEAQLEKRNGVVEPILTPDNKLIDSKARTTHENQDPSNVTDELKPGSKIFSAKKYKSNSIGIAAQVAKKLGVNIDDKSINKVLDKQPSSISPAELANLAKKYQTKNTVNSFDTDILKQRSFSRYTDIAEQVNSLVSPDEKTITQLPNQQQAVPQFADGTDGCAGHTAQLKGIMVNGRFAWDQVVSCPAGCVTTDTPVGKVGDIISVSCVKSGGSSNKGPSNTPSKPSDGTKKDPIKDETTYETCYSRCIQAMAGISPESADVVCSTRCEKYKSPSELGGDRIGGFTTTGPSGSKIAGTVKDQFPDYRLKPPFDMYHNYNCELCKSSMREQGKPEYLCNDICGGEIPNTTKEKDIERRRISPDTLNFALANSANIFNLMKTRQQQMYPYVHTPFKKTDTVPISTADHILSSAHPIMQDYLRSGSPAGLAMSMQAYNSALQGRNEYVNQLQNINKNIDVQNTSAFNRNAEVNATNFNNWGQDATALSNAKLMAGPQTMAKAAENSQEYVATVYKRLYEKQLSDYLQKAAGLPAGSFPTISLPAWMYEQNT